jgi:hypothetical protein
MMALPPAALAVGVFWNWPWLATEHARLEPWEIPLVWLTLIVALFWYLQYWIYCCTLDLRPNAPGREEEPRKERLGLVLASFAIGIAIDVAVTLLTVYEENSTFQNASRADAQVISARARRFRESGVMFYIEARFQDAHGAWHDVVFTSDNSKPPPQLRSDLLAGAMPKKLAILYDPGRPARNWIEGTPDLGYNRLYLMSLSVTLFTGLLAFLLIRLRWDKPGAGFPSEKVGPLLAAALVLFLSGMGKALIGAP